MKQLYPLTRLACFLLFVVFNLCSLQAQQYAWTRVFGGTGVNDGAEVRCSAHGLDGSHVLIGSFIGTIDLDPGVGVFSATFSGATRGTFIVKLDSNANFVWAGTLTNPQAVIPYDMQMDSAGNIYIVGFSNDVTDYDIGPGFDFQGQAAALGGFILKLSTNGQYQWAKALAGVDFNGTGFAMDLDAAGSVFIVGNFDPTTDFDTGPGTYYLPAYGGQDAFFAKYDANGNMVWVKPFEGYGMELGQSIHVDATGISVMGTWESNSLDVDPDPNAQLMFSSPGLGNVFVARFDLAGTLLWARHFHSRVIVFPSSMAMDAHENLVIAGYFSDTVDFDPGPGLQIQMAPPFSPRHFLLKLDSRGDFCWFRRFGAGVGGVPNLNIDANGDVYANLEILSPADVDPGPGVHQVGTNGSQDIALLRLDPAGNFRSVTSWGGTGQDGAAQVSFDHKGNVYEVGAFQATVDFDPTSGTDLFTTVSGTASGFIVKMASDSCVTLVPQIDTSTALQCLPQNGMVQASCNGGTPPYQYVWSTVPQSTGATASILNAGLYQLTVTDSRGCTASLRTWIEGPATVNGFDWQANLVAQAFLPGLPTALNVDAFNHGCTPSTGTLKLILDPQAAYQSATPVPTNIVGDTLFWNLPLMNADAAHFIAQVNVLTQATAQVGDSLHFGTIVLPSAGDLQPANNSHRLHVYPVVNTQLPNSKSVYPPGVCEAHYVLPATPLTYTIQFQNTGIGDVLEVMVIDTLDPMLDLSTFSLKGSSHAMVTELLPTGNILRFVFRNIHLPDSGSNPAGSHGYVIYELSPLPNTPVGTEIRNRADIFMDCCYSDSTNSVWNTYSDIIYTCGMGIATDPIGGMLEIFPNPAQTQVHIHADIALGDVRVVNMLGQVMWARADVQEHAVVVDVSGWARGVYVVRVGAAAKVMVVK